jgi:hypothetical protein
LARDGDGLAILRKLLVRVPAGSAWCERLDQALSGRACVGVHLGVFVEPFLGAILDGRKTIESRFGLNRSPPFKRVSAGDLILLKRSGGPVVGLALAGGSTYYHLERGMLEDIRAEFAPRLYAEDDEFWEARAEKRFATLIEIDDAVEVDDLAVDKRDRRGWVTYVECRQPCMDLGA